MEEKPNNIQQCYRLAYTIGDPTVLIPWDKFCYIENAIYVLDMINSLFVNFQNYSEKKLLISQQI